MFDYLNSKGLLFLMRVSTSFKFVLYKKTRSLWICVMTHSLINMFSQISVGGNMYISIACKIVIICIATYISRGKSYYESDM